MSDNPYPRCGTCGRLKKPVGRDMAVAAWDSWCTPEYSPGDGCPDYYADPRPHHLWPSEVTVAERRIAKRKTEHQS